MSSLILMFLWASLVLYSLLGGADFGAGLWELRSTGLAHDELVSRAMGPVWETNHLWVIIALVILFVAFPPLFRELSLAYHIPLSLFLLGITMRGCAFAFRHYDADQSPLSRSLYSSCFRIGSALASLAWGLVAGGLSQGAFPGPRGSFAQRFLQPWLGPVPMAVAAGVLTLFALNAAVFLQGEAPTSALRTLFTRRAKTSLLVLGALGLGLLAAEATPRGSSKGMFWTTSWCVLCAGLCLITGSALWRALGQGTLWPPRILLGGLVACIVSAWGGLPVVHGFSFGDGPPTPLLLASSSAPVLRSLAFALTAGGCIIFPAAGYLFWVFGRLGGRRPPAP